MPNLGPDYALAKWLSDLDRRITLLESEQPLQGSSSTNPDGTTGLIFRAGALVSANFDGDLSVPSVGTQGVGIGGPHGAAVIGDLLLRPGSIGNDILTNPTSPLTGHAQAGTFALTTTASELCRITFTPPAGFTQALVFGAVNVNARNKNTGQDFMGAYCDINGLTHGYDTVNDGSAGYTIGGAASAAILITGLTGTFYVRCMAYSGLINWASDAINGSNVDAMVIYFR